jgi:beta-phosphoglucomutase-like phosphatase (HAD superfamily)
MKQNLILTDCDGVLVNWKHTFDQWMARRGHQLMPDREHYFSIGKHYNITPDESKYLVRTFNESAQIGFLPPLRDAIHYVKRLHEEHGFVFHVITSLSDDHCARELRKQNLTKLFGATVFEEVVCLATGADKNTALAPYRDTGCYWIEDSYKNARLGVDMGLASLMMDHPYNHKNNIDPVRRVKNWQEIYEIITG